METTSDRVRKLSINFYGNVSELKPYQKFHVENSRCTELSSVIEPSLLYIEEFNVTVHQVVLFVGKGWIQELI